MTDYLVPSMQEIADVPKNGLKIVSTFSGCGGSCLGFEMAGFEVLWANEFVAAARHAYQENHLGVHVDPRDIRQIKPEEILAKCGLKRGELDVLEGSPPCAAFSTAGKTSEGWGKVRKYSDVEQRVDDLFWEFTRILSGLRPKVFIAENVAGLVRGVAKGYFKRIIAEMSIGYVVQAQILDAQWLGVPQVRKRVIFQGIRDDLYRAGMRHRFPRALPKKISIKTALWDCPSSVDVEDEGVSIVGTALEAEWRKLRYGQESEKYFSLKRSDPEKPCYTITASGGSSRSIAAITHPDEPRKFSIPELKRLCSFPDDFDLSGGDYAQRYERLGRSVPPLMMRAVAQQVAEVLR